MTRTDYQWFAMRDGKLLKGTNTASEKASSEELARKLSRPGSFRADAYALCSVVTDANGAMVARSVIAIEKKGDQ